MVRVRGLGVNTEKRTKKGPVTRKTAAGQTRLTFESQ